MFGYDPIAFHVPCVDGPTKSPDQLANERIDEQARDDGQRPRLATERLTRANAIITVETSRRSEFPSFTRGQGVGVKPDETALQFADRVRDELLKLQREL
jgi:hypothetical protein